MGMPRIANGGPERARKRTLGEREGRSCKHRVKITPIFKSEVGRFFTPTQSVSSAPGNVINFFQVRAVSDELHEEQARVTSLERQLELSRAAQAKLRLSAQYALREKNVALGYLNNLISSLSERGILKVSQQQAPTANQRPRFCSSPPVAQKVSAFFFQKLFVFCLRVSRSDVYVSTSRCLHRGCERVTVITFCHLTQFLSVFVSFSVIFVTFRICLKNSLHTHSLRYILYLRGLVTLKYDRSFTIYPRAE